MAKRGSGEKKIEKNPKSAQAPNPGLPDKKVIVSERTFISPKGKQYRIIRTTEKDPYDPPDDENKSSS
jgi:hypothetical protein